jgi:hypothetical protein
MELAYKLGQWVRIKATGAKAVVRDYSEGKYLVVVGKQAFVWKAAEELEDYE